jgi:hypothetical protein
MPLDYSKDVPAELHAKLDATDCFKAMRANEADFPSFRKTWVVEYAREKERVLEAWLFAYADPSRDARPQEHIHLTVYPDKSEATFSLHFLIAGDDRLKATHRPHGVKSPN